MLQASALLLLVCAAAQSASISTLIGTGKPGFDSHSVNNPYGMSFGPDGALYFCDIDNHVVRRIDLRTRNVSTVAGSGKKGNSGDGGAAAAAEMNQPYEVRFDAKGNLFVTDMPNQLIRRVDAKSGRITTIAGVGQAGYAGDGGPSTQAQFHDPHSIAFDPAGDLLVCDTVNNRVRRISTGNGIIETILGGADTPYRGPRAIAFDSQGNMFLVLREGNAVFRIDAKTGSATRVAGTGAKGWSGDGGPATTATLNGPKAIAFGPDGAFYLADTENHAIRRVDPKTGTITTVAGTGQRGDGPGDGDPKSCALNRPHGVAVGPDGTLYIADSESHRIRVVTGLR